VKDVRLSERLTDSPVCLVADEGDLDIHLERMLRQHRQLDALSKRILEVNPRHPLVARLASQIGKDGASAVYGSDAVAGVVNFLLLNGGGDFFNGEKPYEGAEIFLL